MGVWRTGTAVALALGIGAAIGIFVSPQRVTPSPVVTAKPVEGPQVKTARAEKRDLPLFASGIGHVQALNTAQIKSRIDGPIEKVLFTEGEQIAAGKPLFQIDERPYRAALTQAEGQLARDQALYDTAKTDYERAVSLIDKGFTSKQTLEQRQALLAGYAAAVKMDQAALDNAKLNLDFTTIRAPISGRIGKRLVDTGNLVHAADGTPLAEIVQNHPITALFTVPQGALAEIRAQMQMGAVGVEALSTDDRRTLSKGSLTLIGNQVDTTSGTIELKASFDNGDDALWPGQLVEARLTLEHRRDVVAIPNTAIAASPEGKMVFVVDANHKVSVRKVKIGPSSEGKSVVESGLAAGERVVVEKLDLLVPGLAVQPEAEAAADSPATPS